ncbi:transketolase family protein [Histidinibacterium aquaticum]|uniref:Transketolase n=1 Tax=Histidinibacterium aquaticum TaxID=2613962 RepID=A0A5J5GCN6_9RHOB|nr:transketolase C-terminal domain-containing protein [Histidinibacterium aquaticum]KAA9005728.1 transketolase [Histidinibacterium aquaticum]
MLKPPYKTVLKPYGQALVDLARDRTEIVCITGDLTRQCEIDLFQETFPDRFIHAGMAEANMVSMAGALARRGHIPFVHTFGVFATRRPLDQIVNSVAYPNLPVRLVGFMPGVSSPGGPSHQAIEDVALMRALPNMTVIDVADATEIRKALPSIVDIPGPVYLRLKRGEIPVIFEEDHQFSLKKAQRLTEGEDVAIIANGMMLSSALSAAEILKGEGLGVTVVNVPVIKPLDTETVLGAVRGTKAVVTAENHTIIGGLGSAVAETMAEAGLGRPLRRIGLQDTFAEGSRTAPHLFRKYGLSTQDILTAAWSALGRSGPAPEAPAVETSEGEYAPV